MNSYMEYDANFWNKYTDDNESMYNEEFSKFIRDLAFSLKANNVLEAGCNAGDDLRAFPQTFGAHGFDLNNYALEKAKKKLPSFHFKKGSITKIPFDDSSMDLVFTHKLLNYISDKDIPEALNELYRVSRKYIANCEFYEEEEGAMNDMTGAHYRNMRTRWSEFKVKIISNVDMHPEIDPDKTRFTLVRKIQGEK